MQAARFKHNGESRWKREEIVLTAKAEACLKDNDKTSQKVVDSGTTLHLHRDRDAFQHISDNRVRIHGVGGIGVGYKGILKPNRIGVGIPAVWYSELPVEMLISTSGLKRDGWETHLELSGDRLQNGYSGAVLPSTTGPSGLSTLENLFDGEEDAFVCAPCAHKLQGASTQEEPSKCKLLV